MDAKNKYMSLSIVFNNDGKEIQLSVKERPQEVFIFRVNTVEEMIMEVSSIYPNLIRLLKEIYLTKEDLEREMTKEEIDHITSIQSVLFGSLVILFPVNKFQNVLELIPQMEHLEPEEKRVCHTAILSLAYQSLFCHVNQSQLD